MAWRIRVEHPALGLLSYDFEQVSEVWAAYHRTVEGLEREGFEGDELEQVEYGARWMHQFAMADAEAMVYVEFVPGGSVTRSQ